MKYEKLFQKGRIGSLTIKNRAVMVPVATHYASHDGSVTERTIRYYEERARGGVGLIITEYVGVDEVNSLPSIQQLRMSHEYHVSYAEALTEAVHRHECFIFAQLHHGGSTSKAAVTGRQAISPSAVPAAPGGPVPLAMTEAEIAATIEKFISAAVRCKRAGFDGVELHGAHSYLISQFWSRYNNLRQDTYGGSFENRMRFIDEIIDGIRAKLGPNFPISVRISGDEMADMEGTLTLEDGLEIAEYLQDKKHIDCINISNGGMMNPNANCDPYFYKPGWKKHVAEAYTKRLRIPVIATNTIKHPDFAESLLAEGVCDFVGLGRSLLADPHCIRKAKNGLQHQVRSCIGCMVCRERLLAKDLPVACTLNARTGREYLLPEPSRGNGEQVAVIGGGPGGMEAARILAERGFGVTLFEKAGSLGGTLDLAHKPNDKELITDLIHSMKAQLEALQVDIRVGVAATPEMVKKMNPAGVFLATGAKPIIPRVPGVSGANVCTAEAVLRGEIRPEGAVAVIGTGLTGLETAELLAERGCRITLVDMADDVGPGMFGVILNGMKTKLAPYIPTYLTGHKLAGIHDNAVLLEKTDGSGQVSLEADAVVLALGVTPDVQTRQTFEETFPDLHVIGDAAKPGRIYNAIQDGYDKAYVFQASR